MGFLDDQRPSKPLGDVLTEYLAGMEASTLLVIGVVNAMAKKMLEAGNADQAWFIAVVDELAESIQSVSTLKDNESAHKKIAMTRKMLFDGIAKTEEIKND